MNIQKFTQKSVEAINDCEKLAYDYGNQELEQEHLLVALLQQEEEQRLCLEKLHPLIPVRPLRAPESMWVKPC